MKWNQFVEVGGPVFPTTTRRIEVKQLGLAKVVFVRTKSNGGINSRQIKISGE